MPSWLKLNKAALDAIKHNNFGEAESLLIQLRAEARLRQEEELECNTDFTEGLLRDAQGQLERAELAFTAALAVDNRLRGPKHPRTAETFYSLGIVRSRRDDHEGALVAYRDAAAIFVEAQPFRATCALNAVASELVELGRHEEALTMFNNAERAARLEPLTPLHDIATAFLGAGETLRRSNRFPEALSKFALVTQLGRPKMWDKLTACVARAWHNLGIVSRYGLQGSKVQAACAFWYATVLGDSGVRSKAGGELASLPERSFAVGDPDQFRVVYKDDAQNIHVASAVRGLYHVKIESDAALGAVVDVTIEDWKVVAIR